MTQAGIYVIRCKSTGKGKGFVGQFGRDAIIKALAELDER
jgi:hypothetical protein